MTWDTVGYWWLLIGGSRKFQWFWTKFKHWNLIKRIFGKCFGMLLYVEPQRSLQGYFHYQANAINIPIWIKSKHICLKKAFLKKHVMLCWHISYIVIRSLPGRFHIPARLLVTRSLQATLTLCFATLLHPCVSLCFLNVFLCIWLQLYVFYCVLPPSPIRPVCFLTVFLCIWQPAKKLSSTFC